MELQEVFYTMGIIYMAIMFIVMIAALVAVLVIKHKIDLIHRSIEEKLHTVTTVLQAGSSLVSKAKETFKK